MSTASRDSREPPFRDSARGVKYAKIFLTEADGDGGVGLLFRLVHQGVPGGTVSGRGSQDQELDGNTKTQGFRQVWAAMSVISYVLCSVLY